MLGLDSAFASGAAAQRHSCWTGGLSRVSRVCEFHMWRRAIVTWLDVTTTFRIFDFAASAVWAGAGNFTRCSRSTGGGDLNLSIHGFIKNPRSRMFYLICLSVIVCWLMSIVFFCLCTNFTSIRAAQQLHLNATTRGSSDDLAAGGLFFAPPKPKSPSESMFFYFAGVGSLLPLVDLFPLSVQTSSNPRAVATHSSAQLQHRWLLHMPQVRYMFWKVID